MQWPKNTGETMRKGMKHWLTYIYKGFSAKIEGAQARRRTYAGRGTRANKGQRWEQAGGGERERKRSRAAATTVTNNSPSAESASFNFP